MSLILISDIKIISMTETPDLDTSMICTFLIMELCHIFVIAQTVVYLCHDLMVLLTVDILFYLIEVEKYHYASES